MVYQELVNHDKLFASLVTEPLIANGLEIISTEGRERLSKLILNRYEGDSLNILPSCDCGELQGGYNVGVRCSGCNTTVVSNMERPLESTIWFKAPKGVKTLINPTAWIILSSQLTTNGFNLLEWLVNPTYKHTGKTPVKLPKLVACGFKRSLNYFYENFDVIMEALFSLRLIKEQGPQLKDVRNWVAENREAIFCQQLPMPSKLGFVIETAATLSYLDKTITLAMDALTTIISTDNTITPLPLYRREARTVRGIAKMAEYYKVFVNKTLSSKPGIFRRHVFGGRLHFSARAVISSLSDNHRYDEIHIPWSLALQLLKLHIVSKLLRRVNPATDMPFSPVEIDTLLRNSAMRYNSLIDAVLQELIADSPNAGLSCTFGRNPTLARGSIQTFFITHVKTDPEIITISISVKALRSCNADFDGDEMNLFLIPDQVTHRKLSRLAPHLYALDLNEPRRISGNLAIPAPAVSTIANWMYDGA